MINQNTANRWGISVWGPSDDDFMAADMALGFWEQNAVVVNRDSLVEYAVKGRGKNKLSRNLYSLPVRIVKISPMVNARKNQM